MSVNPRDILGLVFVGLLLYVVARVFTAPFRWGLRVLINGAVGIALFALWDGIFRSHGYAVGLNPVTGLSVGLLGVPGFLLVLGAKFLLL